MNQPYTYEDYEALLRLGAEAETSETEMARQLELARRMRGQPLEARQAGRLTVAPHWMELIGGLAKEKTSADAMKQSKSSELQAKRRRQAQNELIMRGILGQGISANTAPTAFSLNGDY